MVEVNEFDSAETDDGIWITVSDVKVSGDEISGKAKIDGGEAEEFDVIIGSLKKVLTDANAIDGFEYDFQTIIDAIVKCTGRVKENTKVTLTFGQLKRLVKEAEEVTGSLADEVKARIDKADSLAFAANRYKCTNVPVTSKLAKLFSPEIDPSSIQELVCVKFNGRLKYGRSYSPDWYGKSGLYAALKPEDNWLTADDNNNFYIARVSNDVVELQKTHTRMKNKVVNVWWDAEHSSKESKEVDKLDEELRKLGVYVGGEWTEDGPTGENYGFSRSARNKYDSDPEFKDQVDSLIAKHEAACEALASVEESAVEPYLKKFIEFHNANWRTLAASGQNIPYGLDCDLDSNDLEDALDAVLSATNFANRSYEDDDD